jgi:hypothetical protein
MAFFYLSVAAEVYRLNGHLRPYVIAEKHDGSLIYSDLPCDRNLWGTFLTALLCRENAVRYFISGRAWARDLPEDGANQMEEVPKILSPLRYEIIAVAAIERTGNQVLVSQPMTHELTGIALSEPYTEVKLYELPTTWNLKCK